MIVHPSSRELPLPVHEEGHANTAFRQHPLLTVEWIVQRTIPAGAAAWRVDLMNLQGCTVVADKKDERLLLEIVLPQRLEHPADTIVEVSSLALPELEIEVEAIALAEGAVRA